MKCGVFFSITLFVFICAGSCSIPQHNGIDLNHDEFYLGLLLNSDPENIEEKIMLFEKALVSPNEYVRQAAAGELSVLMTNGAELSKRIIELIRREASGWWEIAYDIIPSPVSNVKTINREKALSFLLGAEQGALFFDEARLYVLNECMKQVGLFTETELAVIEGHYAVFKLRYSDGLQHFRAFQEDEKWPEDMPRFFLEYPNLINDLGRAFQFTQANREGLNLFLSWETNLSRSSAGTSDDISYRLLFYAGRIARRMGQNPQATALFDRALRLAPDYEQQDACIWYILDMLMSRPVDEIMTRMERHIPQWYSGGYFNAIMERYLHRLVTAEDWGKIIRTYNLLKDTDAIVPKTSYAWIIARAIEEEYLSAEEIRLAARGTNGAPVNPRTFLRLAYNQGMVFLMPALFYRMQSADALRLPFIEIRNMSAAERNIEHSDAVKFLLGFFNNKAVGFVNPYIRSMENELTPSELRSIAQAYNDAGMYNQAARIVSLYINRSGYSYNRRDLELMYPRPYRELIERNSRHFDLEPALFFSLVRTESMFQSAVVSHAGAVGLSQLMPATAREQAEIIQRAGGPNFFGPENTLDSTNPEMNTYIGAHYLRRQMNSFGDMYLALMAYNGGHGRVRRWRNASELPMDLFLDTVPIYETRDYGKRVTAVGRIYKELYY